MPVKVLFVDDEENILRSLRRLFMDEEFETVIAGSGEEALKLLADGREFARPFGGRIELRAHDALAGAALLDRTRAAGLLRCALLGRGHPSAPALLRHVRAS